MSKRKKTIVTYSVKLELPQGSNASEAQEVLTAAIKGSLGLYVIETPITIALLKKETTYGPEYQL